ncbi:MAG: hypothetical protein Q4D04_02920 [Clostridia bacterium]|nr:hypothetical protein [Clostridia bacterium]
MKRLRLRRTRNSVHRTQRYPLYAAIIVIALLCVTVAILLVQKNRLDSLTNTSLNEMAASIQSDVKIAVQECAKISLPGAKVQDEILPNMRLHLYAAKQMNESMINVYDFEMLDEDAYSRAQSAIDAIEAQISKGRTYDEELAELTQAMEELEKSVDAHFPDVENLLIPQSNVR